MRKKFMMIIPIFIGIMIFLGGCSFNSNRTLEGEGEMVFSTFQADSFTSLNINVPFDVIWRYSDDIAVNIEMQENLFEYVEVSVRNGVLTVTSTRAISVRAPNIPRIYIYSPYLEGISSTSAISKRMGFYQC